MRSREPLLLMLFAATLATPAAAQDPAEEPAPPPAEAAPPPAPFVEPELVFEREVFSYPAEGRRNPFNPLLDQPGLGPRFEDLTLRGIIYSRDASRSVANLVDSEGKRYNARRGDRIGSSRVVEIGPTRVLFAVDSYGVVRQEVLELKRRDAEGATR